MVRTEINRRRSGQSAGRAKLVTTQFHRRKKQCDIFGRRGSGQSPFSTALGYKACLQGHTVLFATAVDAVNNLVATQSTRRLKLELRKYYKPSLLILDELGYLPIDKTGADMLFQIISHLYEQGSLIITTNRA